jgi:hypothetical protein
VCLYSFKSNKTSKNNRLDLLPYGFDCLLEDTFKYSKVPPFNVIAYIVLFGNSQMHKSVHLRNGAKCFPLKVGYFYSAENQPLCVILMWRVLCARSIEYA